MRNIPGGGGRKGRDSGWGKPQQDVFDERVIQENVVFKRGFLLRIYIISGGFGDLGTGKLIRRYAPESFIEDGGFGR